MQPPRLLLTILAAICLLSAPAAAQTMKVLSYNTNGLVAYTNSNPLEFRSQVRFSPNGSTYPLIVNSNDINLSVPLLFNTGTNKFFDFENAEDKPKARADLGFSTNLTSLWTATNANTAARALSGSTNTNEPFSGTFSVVGTNSTNTLTFSNGILLKTQ